MIVFLTSDTQGTVRWGACEDRSLGWCSRVHASAGLRLFVVGFLALGTELAGDGLEGLAHFQHEVDQPGGRAQDQALKFPVGLSFLLEGFRELKSRLFTFYGRVMGAEKVYS